MDMVDFIDENTAAILQEFEEFAGSLEPAAEGLGTEELRNLAGTILRAICDDMRSEQSEEARHRKSRGGGREEGAGLAASGQGHAAERLSEGFTLRQLVAEYRALRASVIRRWREALDEPGEHELEELTRFNEAMDESLAEAVGWYHLRIEDARDLLNGILAHDLRTPLGSLLVGTETLMQKDNLAAGELRSVVLIFNSARRMRQLLNDLLDFTLTRLGTGMPVSPAPADLGRMLRRVCDELQVAHPHADIRAETSGELSGCWDTARVEQMLSNLVDNAIRHGVPGRPISVSAQDAGEELVLEVHNESQGIPEDQQKVMFDPLRRATTQEAGHHDANYGSGLGLYIARQVAEAHGGTIDVRSTTEEGTTFTVRLPRQKEPGAETAGMT